MANRVSLTRDGGNARGGRSRFRGPHGRHGPARSRALQVTYQQGDHHHDDQQDHGQTSVIGEVDRSETGPLDRPSLLKIAKPVPLKKDAVSQIAEGEGGQGQRQAAEAQGREGHHHAEEHGHQHPDQQRHDERRVELVDHQPGAETGGGDEGGLGQAHHAAHPGDDGKGQEDQGQGQTAGGQTDPETVRAEVQVDEQHRYPEHGRRDPSPSGQAGRVVGRGHVLRRRPGPPGLVTAPDRPGRPAEGQREPRS